MTPGMAAGLVGAALLAASLAGNAYLYRAHGHALEALGTARNEAATARQVAGQCSAGVVALRKEAEARAADAARRAKAAEDKARAAAWQAQRLLQRQPAGTPCEAAAALNREQIRARRAP